MNFVIKFSNSKNHNVICIIIDRLIKKQHYVFCTIANDDIAIDVYVKILFYYVFKIYELSLFIISNKKIQFVNLF